MTGCKHNWLAGRDITSKHILSLRERTCMQRGNFIVPNSSTYNSCLAMMMALCSTYHYMWDGIVVHVDKLFDLLQ